MSDAVDRILKLEVPIIVRLGEKSVSIGDVLGMVPGVIIELPKPADDELELLVNNKTVGCGTAVKVGENFGIKLSFIGNLRQRIEAMSATTQTQMPEEFEEDDAETIAEQLLADQL